MVCVCVCVEGTIIDFDTINKRCGHRLRGTQERRVNIYALLIRISLHFHESHTTFWLILINPMLISCLLLQKSKVVKRNRKKKCSVSAFEQFFLSGIWYNILFPKVLLLLGFTMKEEKNCKEIEDECVYESASPCTMPIFPFHCWSIDFFNCNSIHIQLHNPTVAIAIIQLQLIHSSDVNLLYFNLKEKKKLDAYACQNKNEKRRTEKKANILS